MIRKTIEVFIITFLAIVTHSCKISFSFSGATIPLQAKTFSVKYFTNKASLVQPILNQRLTEHLRDRIMYETSLQMVNSDGDLAFEGEILSYNLQPVAIQGNETAQLTQLTVTINVRFFNKIEPDKNFESTFTRYHQFPASANFASIENQIIDQIVEQLVDDIFNKAFINW